MIIISRISHFSDSDGCQFCIDNFLLVFIVHFVVIFCRQLLFNELIEREF